MAFLRKQPLPHLPHLPHRFFPTCPLGAACGTRTMSAASREPPTPKAAIRTALRAAVRMPEQSQLCPPAIRTTPEAAVPQTFKQPAVRSTCAPHSTRSHSQTPEPPAVRSACGPVGSQNRHPCLRPAGDRPPINRRHATAPTQPSPPRHAPKRIWRYFLKIT